MALSNIHRSRKTHIIESNVNDKKTEGIKSQLIID